MNNYEEIKELIRIGNLCGPAPTGEARRIKQECADRIQELYRQIRIMRDN